jgi:hypothetical protein
VRPQPFQETRNVKFSAAAAAAAAAAATFEPVTPTNADYLHAARQLLRRGVKLLFVNVTTFLFGLRAQQRRGALFAEFASRIDKPDNLNTARAAASSIQT